MKKKKAVPVKVDKKIVTRSSANIIASEISVKGEVEEKQQQQQQVKKTRVAIASHDDLDAEDFQDPMMVSEYVTEIFSYLKELEVFYYIDYRSKLCLVRVTWTIKKSCIGK